MSETSDVIKSLRSAPYNLSQTEIFRKTGIPQSRISRWEAGITPSGADDALKLVALQRALQTQFCEAGLSLATPNSDVQGISVDHPVNHGLPLAGGLAVCQPTAQGV